MRASNSFVKNVLLLPLVLVFPFAPVHPQQATLLFKDISPEEGIPTNVRHILQDRTGYLWFATWSGLYKYDGYNFVSYRHDADDTTSIRDDELSVLYEDKAGVLWIGSLFGLEKFDRRSETFVHYTPDPSDSGNCSVSAICEDRYGVLWVGTDWGLYQFDKPTGTFTSLRYDTTDPGSIFHNAIHAIFEDKEGSLWVATAGGLDRYDSETGKFIHYWNDPRNRQRGWDNTSRYWITSLCGDDTGTLWLGTKGGLVEFKPKEASFSVYRLDPKRPQNPIISICRDVTTGSLWVTARSGLLSFDRVSKTFTHYDLKANHVYSERSGTLWVGTDVDVKKLDRTKQPFTKYPSKEVVGALCNGTEGMLWVLTVDAKWRQFDPRKDQFVSHSFGKDRVFYVWNFGSDLSIRTEKGDLYIQDTLGNIRFSLDSSWKDYLDASTFGWKGREGYWHGSRSGDLDLWEPKTNCVLKIKNFKHPILWLYEDTFGLLWVATYAGTLFCYDHAANSTINFVSDPSNVSGIRGRLIGHIYEDRKGRLWFATNAGLKRYERSTNSFIHFTERSGLPSNNIHGILEDDHGFLWLNTGKGISKFDPETGQFKNYDVSYGVEPAAAFSYGVGCKTRNGEMYFGGVRGFTRFHPDSIKDNPYIPPIVITSFRKFDKPYPFADEVRLPHDENFISFEFAALSYLSSERNQYAYMMEGLDKDWVFAGTRRYASYPGLDPGEYVFRVKGSNNDGVWNEVGTSLTVIVTPAIWQTWWFRSLGIALLVGLVALAYHREVSRLRNEKRFQQDLSRRQIESQEAERKRVAAELHDGLGQDLLVMNNELQKYMKEKKEPHRELEQVASILHESIEGVREIASNLHPHHLERLGFSAAIEAMVERVSRSSGPAIRCTGDTIDQLLPKEAETHLYRIIQEALTNAVRYASARSVTIELSKRPESIEVVISDDGGGFDMQNVLGHTPSQAADMQARGFGLLGMAERARIIGGKLTIESSVGSGTVVHVMVPYL